MIQKDTFLYIYSKHSNDCNKILPIIHQIANNTGLIAIDADNPKVRNYLMSLNIFKTVPCIILSYPTENRLEIYEGLDVINLINKILKMCNKPSVEYQLNFGNQINSNSIPNMRSSPPPQTTKQPKSGKTMIDFSQSEPPKGKTPIAVRIDDPFEELREADDLMNKDPSQNHKNEYLDRMSNPNLSIKKGDGHESLKNSSLNKSVEISAPEDNQISTNITSLDDDYSFNNSNDDSSNLLLSPTKVNMMDLVGPNGPPPNRELEAKQEKIKNAAAAMMSEREALDSQFSKHKGGSG
jgi:hypothetical protein